MSSRGWFRNLIEDIRWGFTDWFCRRFGHRPYNGFCERCMLEVVSGD